ncbi:hypothetical protein HZH66_008499 [Vespula vulgaris]|uniref:Phosphoglycolate phosphatase n=1 Tax=Vespula vulgaris TaxID=7454 RepID=A0A834JSB3_VESVU|nr:chronophin-like [Vespula vulgaris]KAF7392666.1 hypothetical protein HZH66_008499 [Vespula vulgaris]
MPETKDLRNVNEEEIRRFLDSFDIVLSDCDGVLWHIDSPIENSIEALTKLQSFGKKIFLVTNNATAGTRKICERLLVNGLEAKEEQVIIPSKVIAWYLKKINFQGQAFTIAMEPFRKVLMEAGIELLDEKEPNVYPNNVPATLNAVQDRQSVKAVITDFDVNCNWAKLTFAISCLKRKDVLYVTGALDKWVSCSNGSLILGPGPLIDIITEGSGRTPISCGKPSDTLRNYIFEFCNVINPKRCLFIGDTVNYDMKFGALCGFQKFFVSTGCDSFEESQKNEDTCPEYYLPNFGQLLSILDDMA